MLPSIRLGSLVLSTYWMMLGIGSLGMLVYVLRVRKDHSLSVPACILFTCILTVVGVLGAKLLYILESFRQILEEGISLSGVSFFGSVFLIPLVMPLAGKLFKLKGHATLDLCGPCVAVMIGCLRLGCFLQVCCGGTEACLGSLCFRWPTQAIESLWDFFLLSLLAGFAQQKKHSKCLYPSFMLLYSSARFFIEFLRDTPKDWLCLSHGQWFSLIAVSAALVWICLQRRADAIGKMQNDRTGVQDS